MGNVYITGVDSDAVVRGVENVKDAIESYFRELGKVDYFFESAGGDFVRFKIDNEKYTAFKLYHESKLELLGEVERIGKDEFSKKRAVKLRKTLGV